jgi:hypothetical protein
LGIEALGFKIAVFSRVGNSIIPANFFNVLLGKFIARPVLGCTTPHRLGRDFLNNGRQPAPKGQLFPLLTMYLP